MAIRAMFLGMLVGLWVVTVAQAQQQPQQVQPDVTPRVAIPSDTGHYRGYHVGGGAVNPRKAEPRRDDEGTWGWDYQGLFPRRIILGWWHGRRYQGGTGAYKTDGPRPYEGK